MAHILNNLNNSWINVQINSQPYGLNQVRSRSEPNMNFIPIKVLGGGQTSDYDRKLLGTLGVKKNHISNGFSGGNGAS